MADTSNSTACAPARRHVTASTAIATRVTARPLPTTAPSSRRGSAPSADRIQLAQLPGHAGSKDATNAVRDSLAGRDFLPADTLDTPLPLYDIATLEQRMRELPVGAVPPDHEPLLVGGALGIRLVTVGLRAAGDPAALTRSVTASRLFGRCAKGR